MSLSLNCPNCGGEVGECDSSNNYIPVYYKSDKNGQPECPHCRVGDEMVNFERNMLIGIAAVFLTLLFLTLLLAFFI